MVDEEANGGDAEAGAEDGPEDIPSLSALVDAVEKRRERMAGSEDDRKGGRFSRDTEGSAQSFDWVDEDATAAAGAETDEDGEWEMVEDATETASTFGEDPKSEAILEVVGDVPNVLLMGPLLGPADYDACTRLTSAVPGGPDRLLLVTLSQSADERLNVIRGYLGDLPPETVVIEVGGSGRSGTRSSVATEDDGEITVETVSDPTDLRRIGIMVSQYLAEWEDPATEAVLCVHSLTALLQFTDDPRFLFRFLHVLQQKVRQYGATAHYHLDAEAHDPGVVDRFRPLFDEALVFHENGSLSVAR